MVSGYRLCGTGRGDALLHLRRERAADDCLQALPRQTAAHHLHHMSGTWVVHGSVPELSWLWHPPLLVRVPHRNFGGERRSCESTFLFLMA